MQGPSLLCNTLLANRVRDAEQSTSTHWVRSSMRVGSCSSWLTGMTRKPLRASRLTAHSRRSKALGMWRRYALHTPAWVVRSQGGPQGFGLLHISSPAASTACLLSSRRTRRAVRRDGVVRFVEQPHVRIWTCDASMPLHHGVAIHCIAAQIRHCPALVRRVLHDVFMHCHPG